MEHHLTAEQQVQRCRANLLILQKLKQESSDRDTPEQSLVRLTVEHPEYSVHFSFHPYSKDWVVSDVGMNTSSMKSTKMMIAVDCEMVLCEDGTEGLVRVGAVDRDLKVILDEFVKPDKPIVDYRTHELLLIHESLAVTKRFKEASVSLPWNTRFSTPLGLRFSEAEK